MKQSVLHFKIISTVLSFLLVLSSTGGITSPQTVRAANTEPSDGVDIVEKFCDDKDQ